MHCANCGRELRPDAQFCNFCGKETNAPDDTIATALQYRALRPGDRLGGGDYTILQPLTNGGMGAIYLATDHATFNRQVVIKTMLDYFDVTNPDEVADARQRFQDEARLLAELRHPGIPQIYTHLQEGPFNYIVMEYIPGNDLHTGLSHHDSATGESAGGQAYPELEVISWGITICRVLEYLATRQPYPVIHHDIKPANLILDINTKEVRLVDFGTARARLLIRSGAAVGVQKTSLYGTQGYAPPEQYEGRSEPRSDVYALAATLYHLATDDDPTEHPFSYPKLVNLSAGFARVLRATLRKKVDERPDAATFRQQLEALLPKETRGRAVQPIETPTGEEIRTAEELAIWCAQNWERAAAWLYDSSKLPRQIERLWGRNKLAREMRAILRQYPMQRYTGLDATIALLDPDGFGAAPMQATVDPAAIDFGAVPMFQGETRRIRIRNTGRRYLPARLDTPAWIENAREHVFGLLPGQVHDIVLTTVPGWRIDGQQRENAQLWCENQVVCEIPLQANSSSNNLVGQRSAPLRAHPGPMPFLLSTVFVGGGIGIGSLLAIELHMGTSGMIVGATFGVMMAVVTLILMLRR